MEKIELVVHLMYDVIADDLRNDFDSVGIMAELYLNKQACMS